MESPLLLSDCARFPAAARRPTAHSLSSTSHLPIQPPGGVGVRTTLPAETMFLVHSQTTYTPQSTPLPPTPRRPPGRHPSPLRAPVPASRWVLTNVITVPGAFPAGRTEGKSPM